MVVLYSLTLPIPFAIGLLHGEEELFSFLATFMIAFFGGITGVLSTRSEEHNLQPLDGFLVAVLFWLIFSAISAMPLYLDTRLNLTLTDAVFEGVSGITTTGASILNNIDDLPRSILYYRAQLNFLGGLGIIVLAVAVMPLLGIGGGRLYQSEMPGPLKEERFTPRLADTAKHLWFIYATLALACGISYYFAGMDWFHALCHSLSTVSLGGFSSHSDSLGYYNSNSIELVGGFFSILAAINYALYFLVVARHSIAPIFFNPEFRFFLLVLFAVIGITSLELYRLDIFDFQGSMVHGFFQATSIMTDNGLTAANYPSWPAHIVLLLLSMSFFGGCVGSTCGGIKAMRFLLLYRQTGREVKQLIYPNGAFPTRIGNRSVPDRVERSVWGLFFLFIASSVAFVWGLVAIGHDIETAIGTVAACINNMGVGYGETASGFSPLKDSAKWLMCMAMLFGRLEIFPILVVFSRTFWRF